MKILIVKLGSIGDIVHTLPALAAISRALPNAEISWVVESRSAEILRGNELIKNLIEVDTRAMRAGTPDEMIRETSRQLKKLRKLKFDIAIDFQGLLKSAVIAKLSGATTRYGFSKDDLREPASRILMHRPVEIPQHTHIIRKNLLLAQKALNIPVSHDHFDFPIFTGDNHKLEAEKIISEINAPFVILNPAGGWITKLWHAEKYCILADMLWEKEGLTSVVATGPGENDLADRAMQSARSARIVSVQPTLKGFYELARQAKAYVGGDTGPTHLAIAAGTPVVGIFGPTEWWRNGSPLSADICVERSEIGCRVNCHRRTCSNWICMDIAPETVFEAVRKRLG